MTLFFIFSENICPMRVDPCTSCVFITIFTVFDTLLRNLWWPYSYLISLKKTRKLHDTVKNSRFLCLGNQIFHYHNFQHAPMTRNEVRERNWSAYHMPTTHYSIHSVCASQIVPQISEVYDLYFRV